MSKVNVLNQINFLADFKGVQPKSPAGIATAQKLSRMMSAQSMSYKIANVCLNECVNSPDADLRTFAQNKIQMINESYPISFAVGLSTERLMTESQGNSMLRPVLSTFNQLTNLNESEMVQSIANGALRNLTWNPMAKSINDRVNTQAPLFESNHRATTYAPISYLQQDDKGNNYFRIGGVDLVLNESGLSVNNNPTVLSPEYMQANTAVQVVPYDPNENQFHANTPIGQVVIDGSTGGVTVDAEPVDAVTFAGRMNDCVTKMQSDARPQHMITESQQQAQMLYTIMTNHKDLMCIDQARVAKLSGPMNESVAFMVFNNRPYGMRMTPGKRPLLVEEKSVVHSVKMFESVSGVNLTSIFGSQIMNEQALFEAVDEVAQNQAEAIESAKNLIVECDQNMLLCDQGSERWTELNDIKRKAEIFLAETAGNTFTTAGNMNESEMPFDVKVGDTYKAKKGNFKVKVHSAGTADRFGRTGSDAVMQPCIYVEALNSFADMKKGDIIPFFDEKGFFSRYEKA